MAAMATIMKPLAGAIPAANLGVLPTRRCKQSRIITSSRRRVVVRAESSSSGESLVGQTPTGPVAPTETASLATEVEKPEETPASPIELRKPEVATPGETPAAPIASETAEVKKPEVATPGETPAAPIASETAEVRKPELATPGETPASPIELRKPEVATSASSTPPPDEGKAGLAAKFDDPRWRAGTWDITKFTRDGKVDWDTVIDAEVGRRKWLEANPEASNEAEPVVFDTGTVPWWAWVKRFHLPEAELLNGRAAMVGYGVGYLVDSATGAGLVDQQSSFLGKLLILFTVLGVLLIRKNSDVQNLRTIVKESTFYDKQWQATWKDDDDDNDKPTTS